MTTTDFERTWDIRRKRSRSVSDESRDSYYGLPVIHKAHWKWEIYLYFFLGGIAGASYVISTITQLLGGAGARKITRVGRYLSLATLIPSPILLILDLGRPDRFHHMLRVIKLRSPMSLGTWGLVLFSGFSGLSALIQAEEDGLFDRVAVLARLLRALPARTIGVLGTIPAFFVSGYTGVLLAATAVPLWTKNYLLMGPMFIASSLSNATAAITLILSLMRDTSEDTLKRLERLDLLTLLAELALLLAARLNLGPVIGRPLDEGKFGAINKYGVLGAGIFVPLVLQARDAFRDEESSRVSTVVSSLLVLIGGFLFRYMMVMAGRESADDPQATFELTRSDGRTL